MNRDAELLRAASVLSPEEYQAIRDEIDRLVETGASFPEAIAALSRFVVRPGPGLAGNV